MQYIYHAFSDADADIVCYGFWWLWVVGFRFQGLKALVNEV